jgi:hypothetical protein
VYPAVLDTDIASRLHRRNLTGPLATRLIGREPLITFVSERQRALLEAAARWLKMSGADGDSVTPLAVLEPLVAKEGMRRRPHPGGDALTLIPYLVPPAAVSDVRAGVRALATECGKGTDIRRAVAGVRLLESALAEPHGYFGNNVAEEPIRQWHDEDTATLDALAAIALETGEPVVRLQVRQAASWVARHSRDEPLAQRASSLIAAIDEHSEAWVPQLA